MGRSNRILMTVVIVISACAVLFVGAFGAHCVLCNPLKLVIPTDMKTFTVVMGEDMTGSELASYFRTMKRDGKEYMKINSYLCCTSGEGNHERLDRYMADLGFTYLGYEDEVGNMRCYQKDSQVQWVRVEYDFYGVWALWNFGSLTEYTPQIADRILSD